MAQVYVVIGNGLNKSGRPYSKLVPIVELQDGNAYLDIKNPTYLDQCYPLLKKFSAQVSEMKET